MKDTREEQIRERRRHASVHQLYGRCYGGAESSQISTSPPPSAPYLGSRDRPAVHAGLWGGSVKAAETAESLSSSRVRERSLLTTYWSEST